MNEHMALQDVIKLVTNTDTDGEYSIYNKAKTFDEIADFLAKYSREVLLRKEPVDVGGSVE